MFRFADLNRVIWPVAIGEATFRVDYDIFDRKQLRARQQRGLKGALDRIATDGAPKTPDDIAALLEATHQREDADEAELLRRVRGWYDIEDPDGQPLAFSTETVVLWPSVLRLMRNFRGASAFSVRKRRPSIQTS